MKSPLTVKHEDSMVDMLKEDPAFRKASLLGAIEELLTGERKVA